MNLQLAVTNMLRDLGAVATPGEWHAWRLDTRAGRLDVTPHPTWVACRFVDVAAAKAILGTDPRLNPHSGKWNWHIQSDPSALRAAIEALL